MPTVQVADLPAVVPLATSFFAYCVDSGVDGDARSTRLLWAQQTLAAIVHHMSAVVEPVLSAAILPLIKNISVDNTSAATSVLQLARLVLRTRTISPASLNPVLASKRSRSAGGSSLRRTACPQQADDVFVDRAEQCCVSLVWWSAFRLLQLNKSNAPDVSCVRLGGVYVAF